MSGDRETPQETSDVSQVARSQIRRYALIYALVGAASLYFGITGNMKNPPPPPWLPVIATGGALLLLIAGGLVARARWALPAALLVHAAGAVAVIVSLCIGLAHATDGLSRTRIMMKHATAIVAFVASLLFWTRKDVREWLASGSAASTDAPEQ